MKITVYSRLYYPVGGGVPLIAKIILEQLVKGGHDVELVTETLDEGGKEPAVTRGISLSKLFKRFLGSDLVIGVEPSSRLALLSPLLVLLGKKPVVSYQNWPNRKNMPVTFAEYVNVFCAHKVFCSTAVKEAWSGAGTVLPNPYNDHLFPYDEGQKVAISTRKFDFCFVGRLDPMKGVETLLHATKALKDQGTPIIGAIIGDGKIDKELQKLCLELGLAEQVQFLGLQSQTEVFNTLCNSKLSVVPSEWLEPFGIVATEGLAAGCRLVVSEGGGLKDAAGEVADFFQNGSVKGLVAAMQRALGRGDFSPAEHTSIQQHLNRCEAKKFVNQLLACAKKS